MKIGLIESDYFTSETFKNILSNDKFDIELFSTVKELKEKYSTEMDVFDIIVFTNISDAKKLNKLTKGTEIGTVYWGHEPQNREEQDCFRESRDYFDFIIPKTDLSRFLINVLLSEYITEKVPEFYINEFKELSIGSMDYSQANPEYIESDDVPKFKNNSLPSKSYTQWISFLDKQCDNDMELFKAIDYSIRKDENTKWVLVGELLSHIYLQKLINTYGYKEHIQYLEIEDVTTTKKWLEATISKIGTCFIYTTKQPSLLRYPVGYGVRIIAPDTPEFLWLKGNDNNQLIPVTYYDENTKQFDLNSESFTKMIDDIYDTEKQKGFAFKQTEIIQDKFINKEKLIERWTNVFENFENYKIQSEYTKEIVRIDNRGFFDV